jgi:hypothetical protein
MVLVLYILDVLVQYAYYKYTWCVEMQTVVYKAFLLERGVSLHVDDQTN